MHCCSDGLRNSAFFKVRFKHLDVTSVQFLIIVLLTLHFGSRFLRVSSLTERSLWKKQPKASLRKQRKPKRDSKLRPQRVKRVGKTLVVALFGLFIASCAQNTLLDERRQIRNQHPSRQQSRQQTLRGRGGRGAETFLAKKWKGARLFHS